jgi:hypothetical protein
MISPYGRNDTNTRISTYSLTDYNLINLSSYRSRGTSSTTPILHSSMKPRLTDPAPLFLVLVLSVALLLGPETDAIADQGSTTATPAATTQEKIPPCAAEGSPPVRPAADAEAVEPAAPGGQADQAIDCRAMKRRYSRDATGVRARLGMCRKGGNGQSGGPHRHFRGGERWNTP